MRVIESTDPKQTGTSSREAFAELDARKTSRDLNPGAYIGEPIDLQAHAHPLEREAASLESSAALLHDIAARLCDLAGDLRRICYLNTSSAQRAQQGGDAG